MKLFEHEAKRVYFLLWIVIPLIGINIYVMAVIQLGILLGIPYGFYKEGVNFDLGLIMESLRSAAGEEVMFRTPLLLLTLKEKRWITIATILGWSFVFGLIHINHTGLAFLFIQSIYGIILSIVFLKCGGLHGNPIKGLWASTLLHLLINISSWFIGAIVNRSTAYV